MNNFLLFMGALLVAALGAAFAVPQYIEWDNYRATFEDEASRLLGRRIRVGGSVDLRILPTPYVQFENLRVAGKDGHFGTPLFKAKSAKMWLSVTPLVQGKFQAEQIQLTQPELRLELDETGAGNWNIGGKNTNAASGGFQADSLALQEVLIVDGKLTLVDSNANTIYASDAINGEFSADSLSGPFGFKGTASNNGIKRKIRFSSSKAARDGSLRFKSTVSYANTGVRYTLDGKAIDYLTSPKIEGDLIATLPPLNPGGTDANKSKKPLSSAPLELKAKLRADTRQLKLTDLSLSFEQAGRPQRLSGEVLTTWDNDTTGGRSSTRGSFNASWLDLDSITGAGASKRGPLRVLAGVVEQLGGLFARGTTSRISLKIDQANLGGDTVSDLVLDLAKANGIVTIESLRAQLPGRARIKARGQITGNGDKRTFEGDVAIHGGNLKQFLGWAERGGRLRDYMLPATGAGGFTSTSHVTLGINQVAIQSINAEFDGGAVFGTASYQWGASHALTLDLESPRLNADQLLPDGLKLSSLMELIAGNTRPAEKTKTAETSKSSAAPRPSLTSTLDKTIKLSIGELVVGSATYQDVFVDLSLKRGTLSLPRFRFLSGKDLELDIHGTISNYENTGNQTGKGTLRGVIKANKARGVEFLSRFFQLPAGLAPPQARRRAIAPLRLAVTMSFSDPASAIASGNTPGRTPVNKSVDLVLAGSSRGSQLTIRAWLEGGLAHWYNRPVDISLNATNPRVAELLTQLLPASSKDLYLKRNASGRSAQSLLAGRTQVPGRFHMTATGVPAQTLRSIANLESDHINVRFDGGFAATNNNKKLAVRNINGQMRVDATDASPLLVLADLDGRLIAPSTSVKGTLKVASNKGTLRLDDIQLVVAGNGLTGNATVAQQPEGRRSVVAQLTSNQLTLQGLLRPVLSRITPTRQLASAANNNLENDGTENGAGQSGSAPLDTLPGSDIWPAASFSFKPFENIDGTLKLSTPSLQLSPTLKLANTVMELSAANGEITLKSITGDIPGGRLSGQLALSRARAGARMNGSIRIDDVVLEKLFAQIRPPAPIISPDAAALETAAGVPVIPPPAVTGTGTMNVSFSGQALSPRGMIGALTGTGIAKLGPASLRTMNPNAVNTAADAVLDQKSGDDEDLMREELTARLATGQLNLGPRTLKLTIADGALRAQTFSMQTPHGSVTTTNTIDLTRFWVDSEWQIKPVAQVSQITGKTMTVLPPVAIAYVGNLGELATIEPRISVGALMREMTVRNMERDVEQLELIRLRDEQRAQREEARRNAEELERARQKALIEAQRLQNRDGLSQEPGAGQDQGQGTGGGTRLDQRQPGAPIPPANITTSPLQVPAPLPGADVTAAPAASPEPEPDPAESDTSEPEDDTPRPRQAKRKSKPKWNPFSDNGVFDN